MNGSHLILSKIIVHECSEPSFKNKLCVTLTAARLGVIHEFNQLYRK